MESTTNAIVSDGAVDTTQKLTPIQMYNEFCKRIATEIDSALKSIQEKTIEIDSINTQDVYKKIQPFIKNEILKYVENAGKPELAQEVKKTVNPPKVALTNNNKEESYNSLKDDKKVSYEEIVYISNKMANYAEILNLEMALCYSNFIEMNKIWSCKEYYELIRKFNDIILKLNSLLELFNREIFINLENIANSYSVDGKKYSIDKELKIISCLPVSEKSEEIFSKDELVVMKEKVLNNFYNIEKMLEKIEKDYNKIEKYSGKTDTIKNEFMALKNDIITDIENIRDEISVIIR